MTAVVPARRFASRGGDKLDGALDDLGISVAGERVLDAGGSTGGWTDCLLQRGARQVVYVDVAYGAIDYRLRTDDRVVVLERTNVRALTPEEAGPLDRAFADLSFISLRTVAPALARLAPRLVLLVKPQFELPRSSVPRGGVVRDPDAWREAIERAVRAYSAEGFEMTGVTASRLPGPKGNREFVVALERGAQPPDGDAIARAISEAP